MARILIFLLLFSVERAFAQGSGAKPQPASSAPSDALGRSTPRGTVIGFLTAAHAGNWNSAVQYLDTTKVEDPADLAQQLSVVLDQGLPADLNQISNMPEGNLKDNLPANKESAGTIVTRGGPLDVMLDHVRRGSQSIWLFAPETLQQIPAVYDEFNSTWIMSHMPGLLLRRGSLGVPYWQWLVLAIGVVLAFIASALMRTVALPLLRRIFQTVARDHDDALLVRIMGPLRGLVSLLVLEATISFLRLPLFARQAWNVVGGGLAIIFAGWLFIRVVQVGGTLLARRSARRGGADATAVIRLAERTIAVLTVFIVGTFLLRRAGLIKDFTTLLAGVSVGGIAIAFAAQKTLENLFGGISIIFDKTIRVGDYCKIGSQSGSVEDIGLRSTSLRTDANTVLTIPNGQLSTMNIENFGMRSKSYFYHVIPVRRETTAAQMRALLDALNKLLASHALVEPASFHVRFIKVGPSSLDLEVAAYLLTLDGMKFLDAQQDLLLRIMETIEAGGTAVAFPSQTLYMGRDKAVRPEGPAAADQRP